MDQGQKEIIRVRFVSTAFTTLALAVFKPFGLDAWQWQGYMHLTNIFVLGVIVCLLTDAVMKHLIHIPVCMDDSRRDVNYFIRRNLYFQIINTLLVTLMICLYRHFVMSESIPANHLSWSNFFQTLLIIAFCSFAIGLYWRFKFRSRYLAAELEETRLLNEQLKKLQTSEQDIQPTQEDDTNPVSQITLEGNTNEHVNLEISDLLYIEAVGNYVKVVLLREGEVHTNMLRATMKQMEDQLQAYAIIVRCHRAFMVNLNQVEHISSNSRAMQLVMRHSHDAIPVSRSNYIKLKELLG